MAGGGAREGAGRKPGSPNKATREIRALAGEHAPTAIGTLVELMKDDATPAAARVAASKELIERGFGRTGNVVSLELETPLSALDPDKAISSITDAVAAGELAVDDGTKLVAMIESRMRAVELAELEKRLAALEAAKK